MLTDDFLQLLDIFLKNDPAAPADLKLEYEKAGQEIELLSLKNAVQNIPFGVFICDTDKKIRYINKANEEIVGFTAEEVIGKTVDYITDSTRMANICVDHVLNTGQYYSSIVTSPATQKQFLSSGAPIYDKKGNLIGVIVIDQDYHVVQSMTERLKDLEVKTIYYKTISDQSSYIIDQLNRQAITVKKHFADSEIATSPAVIQAYQLADQAAKTDVTTLLTGETGVGKEVFANYIFEHSERSMKPFIKVNCAAIPEHLLESELFGYEKGAFTGANSKGKPGMFELANGGTIFLDEIGDLPYDFQAKLLRALQQKEIIKVGGTKPLKLDVRIIAATNRDLETMVKNKEFRSDLYYRLNIFPIPIPALRERKEDIPLLVNHFLNLFNIRYKKELAFSPLAIKNMEEYSWPGNIRELENMIERWAVIFEDGVTITWDLIKKYFSDEPISNDNFEGRTLKEILAEQEKNVITWALENHPSIRAASKTLGIDHSTLVRKIQQHGLKATS